ncbi:hypothetical protein ACFTY7_22160 [Streptomyces sp. NPDC057062]|uniref:hypothetical protein n=1 Tax=unclassified Streptomyces TaxID=2593676 RepID=UPI0027E0354D|nr:hypothetical protein [Streptomyces sp. MBT84]
MEILADTDYQGLGTQTGERVVTPPHRKFKKNALDWYEEMHERQRKAHSYRHLLQPPPPAKHRTFGYRTPTQTRQRHHHTLTP